MNFNTINIRDNHALTKTCNCCRKFFSDACKFNTNFIGKQALLEQKEAGLPKKLIGFELTEKGVPRQGYPVMTATGEEIGLVVTGLYAPTVEKYCGHAFVSPQYAAVGTDLQVVIRNKPKKAVVVKRPFYRPAYR